MEHVDEMENEEADGLEDDQADMSQHLVEAEAEFEEIQVLQPSELVMEGPDRQRARSDWQNDHQGF